MNDPSVIKNDHDIKNDNNNDNNIEKNDQDMSMIDPDTEKDHKDTAGADRNVLKIAGMGPGGRDDMTIRAFEAVRDADLIVGYTLYNDLLKEYLPDKEYYSTPMMQEVERCRYAIEKAVQGIKTVLICSGDSGVYGMASLVMELLEDYRQDPGTSSGDTSTGTLDGKSPAYRLPDIEVIPGITAALSGAALLGSPLTNDFAVISLSDLLTPWEVIEKRLRAAAEGDLAIALYNPGSKKRTDHLRRACDIILGHRSPATPCGVARSIGRRGQAGSLMTLEELREYSPDMMMTVFIGNSSTRIIDGRLVTPRGYAERGRTGRIKERSDAEKLHERPEAGQVHGGKKGPLLVFGGTTEGRLLSEGLASKGYAVTLCVATGYGQEVLSLQDMLDVRAGHLEGSQIADLIADLGPQAVFDATHPYADGITLTLSRAAAAAGTRYIRVRRQIDMPAEIDEGEEVHDPAAHSLMTDMLKDGRLICLPDLEAAAEMLDSMEDRAFISTGSRGAGIFGRVHDAGERLTMRILPSEDALSLCRRAGFSGRNLICMQGPFSVEMNEAMFRASGAGILVTKSSGKAGGFAEKLTAADRLGMKVIVILPPQDVPGISLDEALALAD